eukprot:gene3204-6325_t
METISQRVRPDWMMSADESVMMSDLFSVPTEEELSIFTIVLSRLYCNPFAQEFRRPVHILHPTLLGTYLEVIKNPIDLATMVLRVDRSEYASLESFRSDIQLLFANAISFNEETLNMVSTSKHLLFYAKVLWEQYIGLPFYGNKTRQEYLQTRHESRREIYEFVADEQLQNNEIIGIFQYMRIYLFQIDEFISDALTLVVERKTRGYNLSAIWARPYQLVWAQPSKTPWWPGMILAGTGVPKILADINYSRLPEDIARDLAKVRPRNTMPTSTSTSSGYSMDGSSVLVEFFGTHDFGWVRTDSLHVFTPEAIHALRKEKDKGVPGQCTQESIREAMEAEELIHVVDALLDDLTLPSIEALEIELEAYTPDLTPSSTDGAMNTVNKSDKKNVSVNSGGSSIGKSSGGMGMEEYLMNANNTTTGGGGAVSTMKHNEAMMRSIDVELPDDLSVKDRAFLRTLAYSIYLNEVKPIVTSEKKSKRWGPRGSTKIRVSKTGDGQHHPDGEGDADKEDGDDSDDNDGDNEEEETSRITVTVPAPGPGPAVTGPVVTVVAAAAAVSEPPPVVTAGPGRGPGRGRGRGRGRGPGRGRGRGRGRGSAAAAADLMLESKARKRTFSDANEGDLKDDMDRETDTDPDIDIDEQDMKMPPPKRPYHFHVRQPGAQAIDKDELERELELLCGSSTMHYAGDGVVHTRKVDFNAPIFFLEGRRREVRKAALRVQLAELQKEAERLQIASAQRALDKAALEQTAAAAGTGTGTSSSAAAKLKLKTNPVDRTDRSGRPLAPVKKLPGKVGLIAQLEKISQEKAEKEKNIDRESVGDGQMQTDASRGGVNVIVDCEGVPGQQHNERTSPTNDAPTSYNGTGDAAEEGMVEGGDVSASDEEGLSSEKSQDEGADEAQDTTHRKGNADKDIDTDDENQNENEEFFKKSTSVDVITRHMKLTALFLAQTRNSPTVCIRI